MLDIRRKRVTVIGLSKRTGVATVKMLINNDARVVVSDIKGPDELEEEIAVLKDYPVEFELNGHGEKSLTGDLIVVSPGVPLDIPFFEEAARRDIPVISEIELAYQINKARIIAITGTNGKTTTTSLLGNILKGADIGRVRVGGNIGNPLIGEVDGLNRNDWLVVEVSSFQLEAIRDFRPDISIFLNFSPDHLDRHRTVENYWQAKRRIFMNQLPEDYALINFDDQEVVKAAGGVRAQLLEVSLKKEITNGVYLEDDQLIYRDGDRLEKIIDLVDIPLRGRHNIENVAFAALAARLAGAGVEEIRRGVSTYKPAGHRLELVKKDEDGTLYIDDSKATNPDSAVKALSAFDEEVVLIAGGQDRKADFSQFASAIREKVKTLILMGETKEIIAEEVLKTGFNNINIYKVNDMTEAVASAFGNLSAGDCLLLSPGCPSWDMYESYKDRGNDFQKEVLKKRGN